MVFHTEGVDYVTPSHDSGDLPKILFAPQDVAYMLGISTSLMYKLIQTGEIECLRVGKSIRMTQEHIDRFVSSRPAGIDPRGLGLD